MKQFPLAAAPLGSDSATTSNIIRMAIRPLKPGTLVPKLCRMNIVMQVA